MKIWQELCQIMHQATRGWVRLGRLALELESGDKWMQVVKEHNLCDEEGVPLHSFDDLLEHAFDAGRSTIYRAKGLVQRLVEIPDEDLEKITLANAVKLAQLSDDRAISKYWIKKAQTMRNAEFASLVDRKTSRERARIIRMVGVDESLGRVYDEAINSAKYIAGVKTDKDAFEKILADWLDSRNDEGTEAAGRLVTNREFAQRKMKGVAEFFKGA